MKEITSNVVFNWNLPEERVFNKAPLSIDQQITLLEERWLIFNNKTTAKDYLGRISYYRFSWYSRLFYKDENHNFIEWIEFKQISELYNFDKDLRSKLLEILELIEVSFKTVLINVLSTKYWSHRFMDEKHFASPQAYKSSKRLIDKWLDEKRKDNIFIKHYQEQYTKPSYPPSWMIFQLFAFWDTGNVYKSLSQKNKKLVSKEYDLDKHNLESRIDCLSYLRNMCAHSDRVRNRKMIKKVNIREYEKLFASCKGDDDYVIDSLWTYIIVIMYFVRKLIPADNVWIQQFIKFIKNHNKIDIARMWFPATREDEINKIITNKE